MSILRFSGQTRLVRDQKDELVANESQDIKQVECDLCRGRSLPFPADKDTDSILVLAEGDGWRRKVGLDVCGKCWQVVSLPGDLAVE
jgi:hypothetical protein